MPKSYKLEAYRGPWSSATREHQSLRFLEAYTENIRAHGVSDKFSRWYAPSSVFYNGNGDIIRGGKEIWDWVWSPKVFGNFSKLSVEPEQTRVRLIHGAASEFYEDEELRSLAPQDADVVIYEHILVVTLKGEQFAGDPIKVRRMMEWVIGPNEDGTGFEGYQVWQGKVCWDTAVIKEEAARRATKDYGTNESGKVMS